MAKAIPAVDLFMRIPLLSCRIAPSDVFRCGAREFRCRSGWQGPRQRGRGSMGRTAGFTPVNFFCKFIYGLKLGGWSRRPATPRFAQVGLLAGSLPAMAGRWCCSWRYETVRRGRRSLLLLLVLKIG